MSIAIEFKHVDWSYKKRQIVKNISFKIFKGEKIVFVGHNGAGKTTIIKLITKVLKNNKGIIKYGDGYKKFKMSLGVQYQGQDFPEGIKGIDLISFYTKIYKVPFKSKHIQNLLDKLEIREHLRTNIKSLSSGQKQKINILIALISSPKILILDELTTALDITSRNGIVRIIKEIVDAKKITLIMVSHSSFEIKRLSDRMLILRQGELIDDIKTKDAIKKHSSIELFLESLGGSNG